MPLSLLLLLSSSVTCDPTVAGSCGAGSHCAPSGDAGSCSPGCQQPTDCAGGQACVANVCSTPCNPFGPNPCPHGFFCPPTYLSVCVAGCAADSDCDAGAVCQACVAACVPPGNDAGAVGSGCAAAADCPTGGTCLLPDSGFPGGYCTGSCACGCGRGAVCFTALETCAASCSVAAQGPCRSSYSCAPQDNTDVGICLPDCTTDDDCELLVTGARCDPGRSVCILPGATESSTAGSSTSSSESTSSHSGSSSASAGTRASVGAATSSTTGTSAGGDGCGCGQGPTGLTVGSLGALALRRRRRGVSARGRAGCP